MSSDRNTIVNASFNHDDADVVLRSAPSSSVSTLFRVHINKLAYVSTVFRDMDVVVSGKVSTRRRSTSSLQEIPMAESASELSLFLPFFYDEKEDYPDLRTIALADLLRLWEIADKYQAALISCLSSNEAQYGHDAIHDVFPRA